MNEQLNLLIQLQEIDARIRVQQDEMKRTPAHLAELEQRAAASKAGVDSVRQALEEAQKAKRDRDRDLEAGGGKVEKLKSRTSEIKTNKEYTALLKEIETAEQESKAIEDEILKLMEKIDGATAEIANVEQRAKEEIVAIEQARRQLEEDLARVGRELAAVEQERAAVAGRIDPEFLAEYRRLTPTCAGRIVVETRGESCSGCHMSIPPRIYVIVKKNDSIVGCPNCHRILYYKEAIAPQVP